MIKELPDDTISERWHYFDNANSNDGSWHYRLKLLKGIAREAERYRTEQILKMPNPFVGYVDVVENIRMAKEQGFERFRQELQTEVKK